MENLWKLALAKITYTFFAPCVVKDALTELLGLVYLSLRLFVLDLRRDSYVAVL